jgi:hypothetical protein
VDVYRDNALWEIVLPTDSTTAVIPELPSTVNADEFSGTGPVLARVWVHGAADGSEVLARYASGIRFRLEP